MKLGDDDKVYKSISADLDHRLLGENIMKRLKQQKCGSDFSGIHDMIATMKLTF